MPRAWITNRLIPTHPDLFCVLVQFDPGSETPVSNVFYKITEYLYDFDISPGDAWIERSLEGTTLLLDLMTYPAMVEAAGVDLSLFPERSKRDPDAVRVVRVACEVDPAEYAKAYEGTFISTTPDGTTLEEIRELMAKDEEDDEYELPLSFAEHPMQ